MEKQEKDQTEEILDTKNNELEKNNEDENIIEPQEAENNDEINHEELINNLQDQVKELQEKLIRQLAEVENLRARSIKMVDEARDYSIFGFAKDMVPVMDNLSRALEYIPENLDPTAKNVIEGVKMTQNELSSAFKKHALELINPQAGEKFDYHLHHAISQIVTDKQEPGTIVHTMQVGYKIKDRLIRPATVSVSKKE